MAVQGGHVAEDGVVRDGREVLGDRVVAAIVGQLVGDAVEAAEGVLVEQPHLQVPAIAEVVLELAEAQVGDQVGARSRLAEPQLRRIGRRRQEGAARAVVDDAARQAGDVGLVVAGVELQHRAVAKVDVEVALRQGAVLVALIDPRLPCAMHDVQPIAEGPDAIADIGLAGEDAGGIIAAHRPQQQGIGRPLELVVEHPGHRLGTVERARGAVDHLDAGQALRGDGRRADDAQPVHPRVLDHAALEAPRLGPRHLVALLVADNHRGQVAQGVVHRPRLHVGDQVLGHGSHRHRRVEDGARAERSEISPGDDIARGHVGARGHHHLADLGGRGRGRGLGVGRAGGRQRQAEKRRAAQDDPANSEQIRHMKPPTYLYTARYSAGLDCYSL